ncbi:MAG TPA: hypothetical protein VGD96_15105 [Bradyrhizobium sp.]|jgi:hypothetical protein
MRWKGIIGRSFSSDGFANYIAGQIAMQTLMSLLVNLYIGECEDHDLARNEITNMADEMVDKAFIPDLPSQK